MSWQHSRHWVFDMDGTLTVAVHDFEAIKRALEIPQSDDILHHLAALPAAEALNWWCRDFVLVRSRLSDKGWDYEVLGRFSLVG